jgi:pimeloyl-ACP methyl ester carboxylesterase
MFAGAYFRSSLEDIYRSSPGIYMHIEVGVEEAVALFCDLLRAQAKLRGQSPPAKSRMTPESHFVAYSSSVLDGWGLLWNSATARELLRDAPRQLRNVPILILYGSADEQVLFSSAETLTEGLKATLSTDVTLQKLNGAGHCSDYDLDYHSDMLVCLREWMSKILGSRDMM